MEPPTSHLPSTPSSPRPTLSFPRRRESSHFRPKATAVGTLLLSRQWKFGLLAQCFLLDSRLRGNDEGEGGASNTSTRLTAAGFLCAALFAASPGYAVDAGTEVLERSALLVCAAPSNLPYSNRAGEGLENKIAELVAAELDVPLTYVWFSLSLGARFVRETLGSRRCDLIIGISAAHELVLNTNPYYSSAFSLVYPADADFELVSLSDEVIKEKNLRIGLVGGVPPTMLLLENELMEQVTPYRPVTDTREGSPEEQIISDLLAGKINVAVLWGPLAGYLNKRNGSRFKIVPMVADDSDKHRMVYHITMGVRHGEIEWKRQLNKLIRKNQPKIDALLKEYNVPVVVQE